MKKTFFFIVVTVMLSSCSNEVKKPPLVLSTDVWIGAAPLYYAHAKGWLAQADIELFVAPTINDNLALFNAHSSDAITGTQHEFHRLKKQHPSLTPVAVYDRSYGGDVVLSNCSLQQLHAGASPIPTYVEEDTVGEDMLGYFVAQHRGLYPRITPISRSQDEISSINVGDECTIAITFNPHDSTLIAKGFTVLESSKNEQYLIVDGIYTREQTVREYAQHIKSLMQIFNRSVEAYRTNPKEFYTITKPYLGNPTYDDFQAMIANIQWLDQSTLSDSMLSTLKQHNFPTNYLDVGGEM